MNHQFYMSIFVALLSLDVLADNGSGTEAFCSTISDKKTCKKLTPILIVQIIRNAVGEQLNFKIKHNALLCLINLAQNHHHNRCKGLGELHYTF